jgi:hypothetical protein
MDFFHVDDDALFGGEEIADFGAELRRVVGGELAVAFDDDGVVGAVGVDAEVGRGVVCVRMLVRFGVVGVGQGVAPLKVNARDYSGLGARWEFGARAA